LLPEDKYCGVQWSYDLKIPNQDSSKFFFWGIFHEKEAGNIPEKCLLEFTIESSNCASYSMIVEQQSPAGKMTFVIC